MKKFFTFFFLFLCAYTTVQATIIRIRVSDFQFRPRNVNAVIGDTILWTWQNGSHTTTSVSIPAGATPWDAPMTSANRRFGYIITRAGIYNYQCTPHSAVMTARITVSAPLAAGLNNFSVSNNNGNALVKWNVKSSKDLGYFSVQRSTDGENFREVKRVLPSSVNTYSFTDNDAKSKYVYYQVKVADIKGNSQLSDIQMHTRNIEITKLVTNLSPNPISKPGHLMMQFNSDIDGSMRVKLFSQNGKFVKEANMSASKGVNNGHFHMGDLPAGSYYIVCTLGSRTEKHTVIMK